MNKTVDITPDFKPISLIRSVEEKAKESVAAFIVLVNKDGDLYYDGNGVTRQNLIWALRKLEHEIMSGVLSE